MASRGAGDRSPSAQQMERVVHRADCIACAWRELDELCMDRYCSSDRTSGHDVSNAAGSGPFGHVSKTPPPPLLPSPLMLLSLTPLLPPPRCCWALIAQVLLGIGVLMLLWVGALMLLGVFLAALPNIHDPSSVYRCSHHSLSNHQSSQSWQAIALISNMQACPLCSTNTVTDNTLHAAYSQHSTKSV